LRALLFTVLSIVAAALVGGVAMSGWCAWRGLWVPAAQLGVSAVMLLAIASILVLGLAANE
jgi:hypothetical protein